MNDEITTENVVALLTELAAVQMERDEERARADGLIAEVARLEADNAALRAQLAAGQGWRPVTNTNPPPMEHVIISSSDGFDVGWRLQEVPHLWQTRRGRSYLTEEIHGFIEIPPPQE